ncbi:hypothetical protein RHSIM_Rhsim10G0197000 [Rhododendron simsii]|uniref:Uncharacterized protein n=1 Tax=Rhododendron simsii TaxID=118357 RepID=A0A834GAR4_RHOSS|nr:hypothetical protein RHSIM_Rhsim10G0197000 [Rhododendron simsii]
MPRRLLSRRLRINGGFQFLILIATVSSIQTRYAYDTAVALLTADFFARMWFKGKDKWEIYKAKDASVRAVGRT